jgi:hypothetical protein
MNAFFAQQVKGYPRIDAGQEAARPAAAQLQLRNEARAGKGTDGPVEEFLPHPGRDRGVCPSRELGSTEGER